MQINNKKEFYKLWEDGVLGNRTRIFHNVLDALNSGAKRIGFRQTNTPKGAKGAWTLGDTCMAIPTAAEWTKLGRTFIMDDSVPNDKSTMQGEICRTTEGLQGFIAVGRGLPPMRITMAQGLHKHYGYLSTRILLDTYMDVNSRNDLDDLLELYPDAAVEFTCFSVNVGNLPHRNTILWETRNY